MRIKVKELGGGRVVVYPVGRLQHSLSQGHLEHTLQGLIARGWKQLIVDMAKVPFADQGIGELTRSYTSAKREGGDLVLVAPTWRVWWLLRTQGLLEVYSVYENENEALKHEVEIEPPAQQVAAAD